MLKIYMENILGVNFKLMCEQQHILARICREKIIRTKYLKGKEEKRRYKENHKIIKK